MIKIKPRRAQEEMVGFALIIIVVAVILLVFLGLALREPQKENVESYEVNSFIQTTLQYTSDCRDNLEYLSVQKLIFMCLRGEKCLDERGGCEVLEENLKEIVDASWPVNEDGVFRGYELKINSESGEVIPILAKGEIAGNCKGSLQDFSKSGESVEFILEVCGK